MRNEKRARSACARPSSSKRSSRVARITLTVRSAPTRSIRRCSERSSEALDAARARRDMRAVIVRGAGAAFSSGFDLKEQMERRPTGVEQWRRDPAQGFRHRHAVLALPAADHRGGARAVPRRRMRTGAGLRHHHSGEDAFFGEPELKFGAGIVSMILPWIVGPKVAKEIILTGEDRIQRPARPRDRHDQPDRAGRGAR